MQNPVLIIVLIIVSFAIFIYSIVTTHVYFIFYPFPEQMYNFVETEMIGSLSFIFFTHLAISLIMGRLMLVFYTFVHVAYLFSSALSHINNKKRSSEFIYAKAVKLYKRLASRKYSDWIKFENRNFVGFSLLIFYISYIDNEYFLLLSIPIGLVYISFFNYMRNGKARMSGNEFAVNLKFYSLISLPLIAYISASTGYFRGLQLMDNEVILIDQIGREFSGSIVATSSTRAIYYDKKSKIVKVIPWNKHSSVIIEGNTRE